jgi:hypothetical protein
MEREEQETRKASATVVSDSDQSPEADAKPEEAAAMPGAFQTFRDLLERVRRSQQPVSSRRELSRDKSKSLFLLAGASVALLLIFFGVFSRPTPELLSPARPRAALPVLVAKPVRARKRTKLQKQ